MRLRRRAEFNWVFADPFKSNDEYFTLLGRCNASTHPRLGLAVSRKVSKLAVVRNRIKRVVRESFRQHHVHLPALDIVVVARSTARRSTNERLFCALERHWARLRRRMDAGHHASPNRTGGDSKPPSSSSGDSP
ncbi:MAG: ribonuclease P protein component [Candidatus Competibacterales bacterium]